MAQGLVLGNHHRGTGGSVEGAEARCFDQDFYSIDRLRVIMNFNLFGVMGYAITMVG